MTSILGLFGTCFCGFIVIVENRQGIIVLKHQEFHSSLFIAIRKRGQFACLIL